MDQYDRPQKQQFWKDKVRQTLLVYPNIFTSLQRGMWMLRKYV